MQADLGEGLPSGSFLSLDGGILQSNSAVTFNRSLGASGNTFQWTANGGGFAAGAGAMTVNIGSGAALTWGGNVGSQIVGTLKLNSATAANVVTFQNNIDLNGDNRTLQVDDNSATTADYAVVSGTLSNSGGTAGIVKTGAGKLVLSNSNSYNGATTISAGILQADSGVGLPTASFLGLNGGILQSNSASTLAFVRPLGTSGSAFQWTANGGGFAAGNGALNVNVGSGAALTWGTSVGSQIVGTLLLNSCTAVNVVTFQNNINLGGLNDTVNVDDNTGSTADYAALSGIISGSGSLTKSGAGALRLSGSSANTYTGITTVTGGTLELYKTSGVAIPGNLSISASAFNSVASVRVVGSTSQIPTSAVVSFSGASEARFILQGHSLTLAGISNSDGAGVIEDTQDVAAANCTLTVSNSANYSFNGAIRNGNVGSNTLALTKSMPAH